MKFGKMIHVLVVATLALFLAKPVSASAPDFQHWHFLDHYAVASINAASDNDEAALLAIERQAQNDTSPEARAYVFFAKALRERMYLRLGPADHFAMQCMSSAKDADDDEALALCGWLRMNLAASAGDYAQVAIISGTIEAANHRLMHRAGLTEHDVEGNPVLFFLRGPDTYAQLSLQGKPSVHRSSVGPDKIPFTHDDSGLPQVMGSINGTPTKFALDTGTGTTTISSSLAAKLHLDISRYRHWGSDAIGNHIVFSEVFVKSLSVGTFTIDNFNITVTSDKHSTPVLGLDFLLRVGRFKIGKNGLTLKPVADSRCHTTARFLTWAFYRSLFPNPPRIGIETKSNYGHIYALLDTGSEDYAAADWRKRKYFDIDPKGSTTYHSQVVDTLGTRRAVTFYAPMAFNLHVDGSTYKRTLRFYTNLNWPLHINLGFQTMRDFSYYFDVAKGVACMQPVRSPAL